MADSGATSGDTVLVSGVTFGDTVLVSGVTLDEQSRIDFSGTTNIVLGKPIIKRLEKITINSIVDSPLRKELFVITAEVGKLMVVEDDEYDSLGDWSRSYVYDYVYNHYKGGIGNINTGEGIPK